MVGNAVNTIQSRHSLENQKLFRNDCVDVVLFFSNTSIQINVTAQCTLFGATFVAALLLWRLLRSTTSASARFKLGVRS